MTQEQWYTNKDLFEQINSLRQEMQETRIMISKYNGLREELHDVKQELKQLKVLQQEVEAIKSASKGKNAAFELIRNWGGWLFAFITLIVLLINQF